MSLYNHQKKILDENKKKAGLFLGTGTGKTLLAEELAESPVLVICPKQTRDDKTWQNNAEKFGIVLNMTVISKEDLRRDWNELPQFRTVIIDECHTVLGVTPETRQRNKKQIPKTSQIFEALLNYLTKYPPERLYLCSATPISKPMNLWAIAKLFGVHWDFFQFRQKYYAEVAMGRRRIWVARKDPETKDNMARLLKHFGYVGSLNDFFDVPEQTHKTVLIELSGEQEAALTKLALDEADPLVRRARARTIENGLLYGKKVESDGRVDTMVAKTTLFKNHKIDYILERAEEFPKLLVFANYTAQINAIAKALRDEGYTVSTLTGKTKDRTFVKTVDEAPEPHIIVAQCAISSGYQLPSFPCIIFASKSWQFVHYEQALGRVLRSDHLKKNLYIHLTVKGADSDCHEAILSGADFQERLQLDTDTDTTL
jgi:hypothetical protein